MPIRSRNVRLSVAIVTTVLSAAAFAADKDDRTFVANAAQDGLAEVQLAALAIERAGDPKVKEFARQMQTDHGKANDELKALAGSKSLAVPGGTTAAAQKLQGSLDKLSVAKFDREYVSAMVADHQKAVKLFEQEAKNGADPEWKQWAGTTLPTLKHHLEMAMMLDKSMKTAAK